MSDEAVEELRVERESLEEEHLHHSLSESLSEEPLVGLLESRLLEPRYRDSEVCLVEYSRHLPSEEYQAVQVAVDADYCESVQLWVWERLCLRRWLHRLCEPLPPSY